MVSAVGWPRATSSAKLGPESAPTRREAGSDSASTWCGNSRVAVSKPLQAHSSGTSAREARMAVAVSRRPAVDVATIARSQEATAARRSVPTAIVPGRRSPGR